MVGHLGAVTIRSAVISGLFVWAGFMVTTMLVNNAFTGRRYILTVDRRRPLARRDRGDGRGDRLDRGLTPPTKV